MESESSADFLYNKYYELVYIHKIMSNENRKLKQNVKDILIHLKHCYFQLVLYNSYVLSMKGWPFLLIVLFIGIGNIWAVITLLSEKTRQSRKNFSWFMIAKFKVISFLWIFKKISWLVFSPWRLTLLGNYPSVGRLVFWLVKL